MAASSSSQNVELEAAKFLQKHIQESKDEPANLATKLSVILQLMKTRGKEHSMPYQVTSRAMETLINQHGLDIEDLKSSHAPLSGPQVGDSSTLRQFDSLPAVGGAVNTMSEQEMPISNHPFASGNAVVGPSSGHEDYQGSGSLGNRSNQSFDQESPSSVDTRSANSQFQEWRDASNYGSQKDSRKTERMGKRRDPSTVSEPHMENPQKGEPGNTRKGKMNKVESAGPMDHLPSSLLTRIKQEDQMQSVASYDGHTLVSMREQRTMDPHGISSTPFEHSMNQGAYPSNRGDDRGRLSMTTNMAGKKDKGKAVSHGDPWDRRLHERGTTGYARQERDLLRANEIGVDVGADGSRDAGCAQGSWTRNCDNSWMLSGPAAGGPVVIDMIPSFGAHVARDIWAEPARARGVLKTCCRSVTLDVICRDLPVDGDDMTQYVADSRLGHLLTCLPKKFDAPLLCAFIERWQPDTNSFHMPWGEMTIMLHDVEQILMLPIEGTVCAADGDYMRLAGKLLDDFGGMKKMKLPWPTFKGRCIYSKGGLHVESLCHLFSQHTDDVLRARVHLLCLLGVTLFADKSGDRVSPRYLPLLDDFTSVGEYAWGAGTLAYLYRSLGAATRVNAKGVSGCLHLLQCWIYEYFPDFAPSAAPGIDWGEVQRQPRCQWWRTIRTRRGSTLQLIRAQLDQMSVDRVNWTPYGPNQHVRSPRTLFRGIIRCADVSEPYHPWRCMRQLGYMQEIPATPIMPDTAYRGRELKGYMVKFCGTIIDQLWNTFDEQPSIDLTAFPTAIPPSQCAPDYLQWYTERSHRLILPTSARARFPAYDRNQIAQQIGYKYIERMREVLRLEPSKWDFFQLSTALLNETAAEISKYDGLEPVVFPPPSWAPTSRRRRFEYEDEEYEDDEDQED